MCAQSFFRNIFFRTAKLPARADIARQRNSNATINATTRGEMLTQKIPDAIALLNNGARGIAPPAARNRTRAKVKNENRFTKSTVI